MTSRNQYDTEALRLAAPGPAALDDDVAPALDDQQRDLDDLCERWVAWCRSRRLYGPKPITGTILGRMSGCSMRPMAAGGPDAISSAELSAFHIAYTCQPDALDKRVFDLYYVHRVKPVKAAAAALEISRTHFYLVLSEFRKRVASAAQALMEKEQVRLADMQHARAARDALGA